MTADIAKAFMRKYVADGFKRSQATDTKKYPRSPKTVENAARKLSALWNMMMPKYFVSNPWEHVTRVKVLTTLPNVPTEDNVQQFFNW